MSEERIIVQVVVIKTVFHLVMISNAVVIVIFPVYPILVQVLNLLLWGLLHPIQSTRAILQYSKKEHIMGTSLAFSTNGYTVRIPSLCPIKGILVDCREEKMVQQPDVCVKIWVEAIMKLEILKKGLPFGAKATGNVTPQSLNTNVVDASVVDD